MGLEQLNRCSFMPYNGKKRQRNENMKKAAFYILIGFFLALPIGTHASSIVDTIIGKTIQGEFPVKIAGKVLDKKAAVIDGTSYLPVRVIGEALNMEVMFDADLGVELKPKGTVVNTPMATNSQAKIITQTFKSTKMNLDKAYSKNISDEGYIEIDGNQYVSAITLNNTMYTVVWNKPILTYKSSGNPDINFNIEDTYSTGVQSFTLNGTAYVRLSVLGLKGTVVGDTLEISK
jgi:hypothetical protein